MKGTVTRATWGILFVLLGLALAGRAFGVFEFNIFFNGWWTLFIIIPCALRLSERDHRPSSIIGLGIGILLLLSAQGVFEWYMFIRILIALVFIVIGCSLVFSGNRERKYAENTNNQNMNNQSNNSTDNQDFSDNNYNDTNFDNNNYSNNNNSSNNYNNNNGSNNNYSDHYYNNSNYNNSNCNNSNYSNDSNNSYNDNKNNYGSTNHGGYNHFAGVLSGRTIQFVDEVFTGAVVSSILGSVQLDLRNAIINGNAIIETTCILGGVDIFVPSNVKVVNNCTSILAGVDNDVITPFNTSGESYTLFINGTCILGGIEVK